MKLNRLLAVAALLTAGLLPASLSALTPAQTAWQQATSKLNGALNSTGALVKQAPGNDTGKVNALAVHLDQLGERLDALQLAFNEAMINSNLAGDARTAYLTQAGRDLIAISAAYASIQQDVTVNFASAPGGDFLASVSASLGMQLSAFVDGYNVQAINGGIPSFRDPCANISHNPYN